MTGSMLITGAGAVTPLGRAPAAWARCRAGARAAGAVPEDALGALPEPVAARAARAERMTQLVLAAAGDALAAAGLARTDGPPRPSIGVVLGTAFGCFLTDAAYERRFLDGGPPAASPRLFAATVSNAAAGELAIAYRLGGPSATLTAGGAAGLMALGHALDLLRAGRADALVTGGVDALGDDLGRWLRGGGLEAGFTPSEAAAVAVLETPAAARARGATALGTVDGFGAGFDPARDGKGLAAAVASALADARVVPRDVALVVSAAPPALGQVEAAALRDLAPRATLRPKDALGETFGAAGPLGLLAALGEAPRGAPLLVLDVCPSGHVAALVARAGAPA
jgi:3-oxoacyl-[acyl-carrier-protein] synthase II